MNLEQKRSPLPAWWLDGTGPLAIGVVATLIAAALLLGRRGHPVHDAFGTLVLISLIANIAAFDNARGQHGPRARLAIGTFLVTVLLASAALV